MSVDMSKIIAIIVVVVLIIGLSVGVTRCSKVDQGYVGLIVDLVGSEKSSIKTVTPGFYWVGLQEEIYKFPVFKQTYVFTNDVQEGKPIKEGFSLQTADGLDFYANVGIIYMLDPLKVQDLFREYRMGIDEITHNYIKTILRNVFVECTSNKKIEDIYGAKKTELMESINYKVKHLLALKGILVESVNLVSNFELPTSIKDQIAFKLKAVQISEQRELEVRESIAQAQKDSIQASGKSVAMLINARADAEANRLKSVTLNDFLVRQAAIDKWNGELPTYMSSGPLPFIGNNK
jgi:regulator of protease activity HflC (stomatin/prohibitin superfamily)